MFNALELSQIWSPTSPILAVACVLVAISSAWVIQLFVGKPDEHQRFRSIDGLRGYLAFFVFLHHSSIWYFYVRTGKWEVPPSNLFTNFGQSSVALFFMITSFLFITKLIDARTKGICWPQLFISRILRITPLYLVALVFMLFIVGTLSNWQLKESPTVVLQEIYKWLSFTVYGSPNINGVQNTFTIVAGVTWSLAYEWLFYVTLPFIALLFGLRLSFLTIVIAGVVTYAMLSNWHPDMAVVRCFWGGAIAAFVARLQISKKIASHPLSSGVALTSLLFAITYYPEAYNSRPLLFLSISFILIACGSDLFGILTAKVSKTLGEMAYSIYLLHGLILFALFNFALGLENASTLSLGEHWAYILSISTIVIFASYVTYSFIEKPCMEISHTFIRRRG